MDTFLKDVGPKRNLWFVNLRSPNAKDYENNAIIDQYVQDNENVHLIDWNGATQGHDDWLIEDGIHLSWDGRVAYTKLVVDTMNYVLPDQSNTTYDVVILGDTVCLDAADDLAAAYPRGLVDTAEGRLPNAVVDAYKSYADQGVVGSKVVVCMGSDDQLNEGDVKALADAVGSNKKLWLVNVRTPEVWGSPNNELLKRMAEQYEQVEVIDWYGASNGKDEWMADDGTHLTKDGAKAYAELIASKVVAETEKPESTSKNDSSTGDSSSLTEDETKTDASSTKEDASSSTTTQNSSSGTGAEQSGGSSQRAA